MMPITDDALQPRAGGLTLLAAVELQDHLNMVGNDLDRLQRLLDDACATLLASFHGAHATLSAAGQGSAAACAEPAIAGALHHLGNAVVALQFQDMASQLVEHSHRRLRSCADQLARDAMPDDDDDGPSAVEEAPLRPNPVT
ncbi:MAG: hypothetical protein ABI633_09500 [Burkholderiales bacterium]